MHIIFTDLKCRGGGLLEVLMVVKRDGQKGCGIQKSTVKFIRVFSKFLISLSAGAWYLEVFNVFQAFPH